MDLALKYFAAATSFMPNVDSPIAQSLRHSKPFDYKSIMIYDSDFLRIDGAKGYPLVTTDGRLIQMAGGADPERAGISDLDIERVAELYPKGSANSPSTPTKLPSTLAKSPSTPTKSPSKPENPDPVPEGSQTTRGQLPGKAVTKRWWSVQENHDPHSIDPQPWPASDDGSHTITCCFETDAVFVKLGPLIIRALAKWAVALQASSLKFLPDPVCDQQARDPCICSTPGMADETLRIMQAPKDQRLNYAESSLGFRPPNFPIPNGRPQHFMIWPANANFFGDPPRGGLVMAHELGM